jgi:hypothetical protein
MGLWENQHFKSKWRYGTAKEMQKEKAKETFYLFIYFSLLFCAFKKFLKIHLFICAYIVWTISPSCPSPLPCTPYPHRFQAEPVLPSSPLLLKRRHKQ